MSQLSPKAICNACGSNSVSELAIDNLPLSAQPFVNTPTLDLLSSSETLYLCDNCGHMFLNIHPVAYYKSVIRSVSVSQEMSAFRREQFQSLLLLIDKPPTDIKVLEIGAGNGQYAKLLSETFPQCFATEKSSVSNISTTFKYIDTHPDDSNFDKIMYSYGSFDLICCFSYLEHLPDPAKVLNKIDGLLAPGGRALIEVPNSNYIRQNGLLNEIIPDHLHYFTAKSLLSMASSTQLNLQSLKSIWSNYILSFLFTKLDSSTDVSSRLNNSHKSLVNQINTLLNSLSSDAKVAVWGAGHQALFTLASTSLLSRADYVVDSSTAKQGKFIQGKNQIISPPTVLNNPQIKVLFVICAGYNDEVLTTIRNSNLACSARIFSIRDNQLKEENN